MKLKLLRLMELLFSMPAAYFGDLADDIDTELHAQVHKAMKDVKKRELKPHNKKINAD